MRGDGGQGVRMPGSAAALAGGFVVALVALLSIGRRGDVFESALLLPQIVLWAAPPLAYVFAAVGYGVLARRVVRGAHDEAALAVGIGIGALAALSQIAGCGGLLASRWTAIGLLMPGWAGLGVFLWRRRKQRVRVPRPGVLAWVAIVPLAVLVAAASAPPSWLWDSEFGGFDAVSYHLQLPQEWLRLGRIEPVEYCVYSYLPGSFEAGVLHVAAMTGAAEARPGATGRYGLLADGGWRAVSAQFLHAWLAVVGAWLVGRATAAVARSVRGTRAGGPQVAGPFGAPGAVDWAGRAGVIAGVLALATPWTVVVGSLAYNEMAVVGLGGAALVASVDQGMAAWRRGMVAGVLVGAACGFKPTAMTFLTPGIGLVLLATSKPREWIGLIAVGGAAGLAMLLPWMVRNWAACGNPVFPFAGGMFGTGHWTAEQAARYHAGHSFDGPVLERLRLLLGPDADVVPRGGVVRDVERWRGVLNPQFGVLFPAAIGAAAGVLAVVGAARRSALLMLAMLALGMVAWLFTTHLQSRFLMPLMIPACVLIGMSLGHGGGGRGLAVRAWIAVALGAWQAGVLVATFARQREHGPNAATVAGPALFTGEFLIEPRELPAATIGRGLPEGSKVLLVGDAAAFYLASASGAGGPAVAWNTTWDASPLGEAIRDSGRDDPAAWTALLRERGFTHVVFNFTELTRYWRAGWYDPDVTPERMTALVGFLGQPMMEWEKPRQWLMALPEEGAGGVGG